MKHLNQKHRSLVGLIISLLIISFGIISCQNATEPSTTNPVYQHQIAQENLLNNIHSYSTEFLSSHTQDSTLSRSIFRDFWTAVRSDFSWPSSYHFFNGDFWITIIVNVGTSHDTWVKLRHQDMVLNSLPSNYQASLDSLLEYYVLHAEETILGKNKYNYGALHNILLLQEIKDDSFSSTNLSYRVKHDINKLKEYKISTSDQKVDSIVLEINHFMNDIYTEDAKQLYKNIIAENSQLTYEISVLEQYNNYVSTLSSIPDIKEYTTTIINTIYNSEIDYSQKEFLIQSLYIAECSADFWHTIDSFSN